MLLVERETKIVDYIGAHGVASVKELATLFDVTEVTIRRDLKRLEQLELLERTHGGAISVSYQENYTNGSAIESYGETVNHATDALIITPLKNRTAHTLRERAMRDQIPLIAESNPQDGAIYLGCNNYQATYALGLWTGEYCLANRLETAYVLDVTQSMLMNTVERSEGFKAGMLDVMGSACHITSVDGNALYNEAYTNTLDALRLHPEINVIFGINDDSVLGAIQAYSDLGRDQDKLIAVGIGCEGKTLLSTLHNRRMLKAVVAMFPEVVGRLAIDAVVHLWNGGNIEGDIYTPTEILTPDNLLDYYSPEQSEWMLRPEALADAMNYPWLSDTTPNIQRDSKRITFLILYRTHEWYQNISKAMLQRAAEVGADFTITDINDDIRAEIRELRRLIGKLAASYVKEGDTIILDSGTPTTFMAQFLRNAKNITVTTNSLKVFQQLRNNNNIHVTLTGGDYHNDSEALVGRGAELLLQEIRVDKVFIVAGGLSEHFGISSLNEVEAAVRRTMLHAAREVIVLADHTVFDVDSNIRVAELEAIDTVITDAGVQASQRLKLTQQGINVLVAGGYQNRGSATPS